jgi:hypothetical protein
VVQTGIGAVAAIGGGFVGAWWQARGQQRIERDRRRDRAAETAAAAIELLQDLDPYRAVEIERSRYKAEVKALTRRRLDVRGQLWVLAAGHPSNDVRAYAIDAAQALGDSLTASSGLVQSMHEPSTRMRSRTPESWLSSTTGQPLTAWSASLKPSNGRDRPDGSVVQ